ncbi:unnamed protein product [Orchesella dallaii]|uniref:Cobalamin adenosyltransferase-like domain-containing protein n=1 Tax=Orchesella dallaii TaxID=48710 RepID=A0ABP1PTD0_9HEXA
MKSVRRLYCLAGFTRRSSSSYQASVLRRSIMTPEELPTTKSIATTNLNSTKIYTKTGDKGTSALLTGKRRPKDDKVFEALGATEELSACIALAREFACENHHPYDEKLRRIQCILQDIVLMIATPKSSAKKSDLKKVGISSRHAEELEEWIDFYTTQLPPLEHFILPGGGKPSASLHIANNACRRAERAITFLVRESEVDQQALIYINRLSDFLFTAARFAAKLDCRDETIYSYTRDPSK